MIHCVERFLFYRNILEAVSSSLPTAARECLNFLRSEPFCLLLAHLTGLDLVKDFQHHFPQLVTRYTEKGLSSDEPIELLSSDEEDAEKKTNKQGGSQPAKDVSDLEKHNSIKMVSTKQGTEGQVLYILIEQSPLVGYLCLRGMSTSLLLYIVVFSMNFHALLSIYFK